LGTPCSGIARDDVGSGIARDDVGSGIARDDVGSGIARDDVGNGDSTGSWGMPLPELPTLGKS
jgi:hypothetical protein